MGVLHPANESLFGRAAVRLSELEQLPAGPLLYAGLIELRALALGSAAAVRATALWAKMTAHCDAQSMITTAEAVEGSDLLVYASGHDAQQIIGEELAALTHTSSGAAIDRVCLVGQVGDTLPLAWEALDRGELTMDHLRHFARAIELSTASVARSLDAQLVPRAVERGWTPYQLAKHAARAVVAVDPDGAVDRAETAKSCADVSLYPGPDETATLAANGDAITLRQVMDTINARAAELHTDSDVRSVGLRRFNALADLVLGQRSERPAIDTVVTIDLSTWLGLNEHPGELSGYGPISADTARELSRDAAFRRLITDPVTGQTLDLGHDRYRPSEPLRRFVRARDRTCRFPGCERRATRSDLDHITEWDHRDPRAGGATDANNLHALCRAHHNLKTDKLWSVDVNPDGSETWTSPLGFNHTKPAATYPIERLRPPEPDDDLPEPTDGILDADPDPPYSDATCLTPPPLTDEEYWDVLDAVDRGFGNFAERAYDTLRTAGLIG